MSNKCEYDYGFEPYDREQRIWKGIDCANPFDKPKKKGCNPKFDFEGSGVFDDPEMASLQCAYTKWAWDGDEQKGRKIKNPITAFKRRRRRSKMRSLLRKICNSDYEYCPSKNFKKRNKICDKTKVCDDVSPSLSGMWRDFKYFAELVLEAFSEERIKKLLSKKKKNNEVSLTKEQLNAIEEASGLVTKSYRDRYPYLQKGGRKYLSKKRKKYRIKKSRKNKKRN